MSDTLDEQPWKLGPFDPEGTCKVCGKRAKPLLFDTCGPACLLQRSRLEAARALCVGNSLGEDALRDVIKIVDGLAPKPVPSDPFEALLAEMRADDAAGAEVSLSYYADQLEAAMRARKEAGDD